ncbi:hypothetical protein E2542_SST09541 [Spatholobus suberectus]|nr:hypothetical protein E2542_SST09541 [Spatholobus suberectus]
MQSGCSLRSRGELACRVGAYGSNVLWWLPLERRRIGSKGRQRTVVGDASEGWLRFSSVEEGGFGESHGMHESEIDKFS